VKNEAGIEYNCRPLKFLYYYYAPYSSYWETSGWLKFKLGTSLSMNAWIAVDTSLQFSLRVSESFRNDHTATLNTNGWKNAIAGYYRLTVSTNNIKAGASLTIVPSDLSYSVDKPTSKLGGYTFLLHLMDETVMKYEYMDDTLTCAPIKKDE
jgi:hypothetical protein